MLSGVLSNAIERIKFYQQNYPEDYDRVAAELKVVLALWRRRGSCSIPGHFHPGGGANPAARQSDPRGGPVSSRGGR